MEIKRRKLKRMPYDKRFRIDDGNEKLCHATGYEVLFDDDEWWNEYEDDEGKLHYGS